MPLESIGYSVADAVADLREMPAEIRAKLRPAIKRAADPMLAAAKAKASWSTRIPGALRISLTAKGVLIVVSIRKAPHARAYEGIGSNRNGTFRHPTPWSEQWVEQQDRPFLLPAVREHMSKVEPAIRRVVEDTARAHGWKT